MPIVPDLSAASDAGRPLVLVDPAGPTAAAFQALGATVVQEVAKLRRATRDAVVYDAEIGAIRVKLPAQQGAGAGPAGSGAAAADAPASPAEFFLHPATVRRNDRSAASVDEFTGKQLLRPESVPEGIAPSSITPIGNYAVQISWEDGFNQVAPYDQLASIERLVPPSGGFPKRVAAAAGQGLSPAQAILAGAQPRS